VLYKIQVPFNFAVVSMTKTLIAKTTLKVKLMMSLE